MKVTLFRDLPTEHWHSMERYADELARELTSLGCDVEAFVPERLFPRLDGPANAFLNYVWRSLVYPRAARAHQNEICHIADHSYAHLVRGLDASRTVVTCHDLAPLALNEGHGLGRRLWNNSFRAMLSAARLIADSEFTRDEILRLSDYPANQISVVPLGVSAEFFETIPQSEIDALREHHRLADRKIVLHVGTCEPRKNIELILRALSLLRDDNFIFVQVGGQFTPPQRALIESLDISGRVAQLPATFGHALAVWYHTADVFVFPSIYEGFGMPAVEAMACGTPVVCANVTSLPEVVGDAACLIEPNDAAHLADTIRSGLEGDLRERGLTRAKMFTWKNCAEKTMQVYKQMQ